MSVIFRSEVLWRAFRRDTLAIDMSVIDDLSRLASRYPLYVLSAPVFLGLGVQALVMPRPEFLNDTIVAARTLLAGGNIYSLRAYTYPPFPAFFAIPFTPFPNLLIRLFFYLINVAAIVWLARSAWSTAGGSRLAFNTTSPSEWKVLIIGALCSVPHGLTDLSHEQSDLIIGALILGGCYSWIRGRDVIGPALIGIGAAFKGPPLIFAAYSVLRRKWFAAGLIVAFAVGVNLIPDLVNRPPSGTWLTTWFGRIALPVAHISTPLGEWNRQGLGTNQSLAGTVQRVLNTTFDTRAINFQVYRVPPFNNLLLKAIAYGMMLSMLAISTWAAARASQSARQKLSRVELPNATAIEYSLVLILMLLMSPMSDQGHFVVLVLPALCLARYAIYARSRIAITSVTVAAIGAMAINKDLVGRVAHAAFLWTGVTTFSAIALWIGCVAVLLRDQ